MPNPCDSLTDALVGAAAGALGVWVLDPLDCYAWTRESPETRSRTTAAQLHGEPPAQVLAGKIEAAVGVDTKALVRLPNASIIWKLAVFGRTREGAR
jgi:hypothetical protein